MDKLNIFWLTALAGLCITCIQGALSLSHGKNFSKPTTDIEDMPRLPHDTELDSSEEMSHGRIILHSIQKRAKKSRDNRKFKNPDGKRKCKRNNAAMVVIDKTHEIDRPVQTYPTGAIIRGWGPSSYFKNCPFKYVKYQDDQFTVETSGLYMIYSRLTFNGTSDARSQYTVNIDKKTFLTCTADMKFRSEENKLEIGHRCNTIGVTFLKKDQQVSLKSAHQNWVLLVEDEDSYFGITKLA